jgi:hypothetical protein
MGITLALEQHHAFRDAPSVTVAALFKFDPPAADQIRVVVETIGDVEKRSATPSSAARKPKPRFAKYFLITPVFRIVSFPLNA